MGRGADTHIKKALTLPNRSGPGKGAHAGRQGNRQGVEEWREERGRRVFSRWTVRGEWKDVVMGREERKMNGA